MDNLLGILGKIGFDWQVALANLVNFLIILFILKKFAFGPIGKIIAERREKIEKGLEDAKKAQTELTMASVKSSEIINEAQKEAGLIVAQAGESGNQIIGEAKRRAVLEAESFLERAGKEIEDEKNKMRREMREKSADLILGATEKLLKESMDKEKNEKIIKALVGA